MCLGVHCVHRLFPNTMVQSISEWLWWERLWLPANLSWSDLEDRDGRVYAKPSHLHAALPYAFVLLIIRYLFERYIAIPLAGLLGLRDRLHLTAEHNPLLQHYFLTQSQTPTQGNVRALCKKTGWSERRVNIWFRRRRNQDRPGLCKKFCEASWRFVFYLSAFVGGLLSLYDKPWFYDLREVWAGFPKQSMLTSQYRYYMVEIGFYFSLLLSLTFDVKRKDFREQVIHHIATLTLLAFSWSSNYIRVGTVVMVLHDSSDWLLEVGKMFNYAKWEWTCNIVFVLFTTVFMVTRLIILPFWVIHCTWVYPLELYPPFFGYYFFNAMLLLLQMLHLYWAALIVHMFYKLLTNSFNGDDRSDQEEEDSTDTSEKDNHKRHTNDPGARVTRH
ncbi:ceramide synthase 2 [Osmerus eperlanus]|uniref:ceramide synthase 2 n=1 Tax=Osmerus eperlanus TaxID=29151 RepID=UPI002E15D5B1